MTDLQTFREETRDWLEANCPPEMRKPGDVAWGGRNAQFSHPDQKLWLERMGEKGWTCPTWPSEYGGGGLSKEENKILQEEMGAIGARSPLGSFGIWMLGPALLEFATEEQKKEHLPPIVRGEYGGVKATVNQGQVQICLLYTSPSPRDRQKSRMPSSA